MLGLAPVAQLDRALPSEGRGQRFESSRVRQFFNNLGKNFLQKLKSTEKIAQEYLGRIGNFN